MRHTDTFLPPYGSVVPGGDIYQSIDSGQTGKDAAMLEMMIPDVEAGYLIYVVFWSDEMGSPWCIKAGFAPDDLVLFDPIMGTGNAIEWAYDGAGRKMWIGDLGVAPYSGNVWIYIDDLPTDNSTRRTWFDGVYVVFPEPATITLLGLGGLALLRRKR